MYFNLDKDVFTRGVWRLQWAFLYFLSSAPIPYEEWEISDLSP